MQELLIYCPEPNSRIRFATDFLQGMVAECSIRLTEDPEAYRNAETTHKINYSQDHNLPGVQVFRSGFLDETGIRPDFRLPVEIRPEGPVLFPGPGGSDIFAAIFWALSRYEEYQPFEADRYGRFPAKASVLYKLKLLEKPICDLLGCQLLEKAGITPDRSLNIIPSADVDMAFYHRGRGFFRGLASFFRLALSQPGTAMERLSVWAGRKQDPNDSYDLMAGLMNNRSDARIFWHCGAATNAMDKQVMRDFKPFIYRLKQLSDQVTPGIHPGWAAFKDPDVLKEEKAWLEQTTGRKVTDSRQHFILFRFPDTARQLEKTGISCDYSMGYPDHTGFRAGTSRKFRWYDLENERPGKLEFVPFCIMDVTCRGYLGMTQDEAMAAGAALRSEIAACGGNFCFIFHNESMGTQPQWAGWDKVFRSWNNPD